MSAVRRPHALASLVFLVAALLWTLAIAPLARRLPADYAVETYTNATARMRDTPADTWRPVTLVARRVDTTLTSTDARSVIQSDVYWAHRDGTLLFESAGLYAVDRLTRRNLEGLGNTPRYGQFLYPLDVEQGRYVTWDAQFIGPSIANFVRTEQVAGLTLYRFDFEVRGIDETAGYSHLADVPERYGARTNANGSLLVEPESGVVVDYLERGHSFFSGPRGVEVAGIFDWAGRFTVQSRSEQLERARTTRLRLRASRYYVPLALVSVGALLLLSALWPARRRA